MQISELQPRLCTCLYSFMTQRSNDEVRVVANLIEGCFECLHQLLHTVGATAAADIHNDQERAEYSEETRSIQQQRRRLTTANGRQYLLLCI